MNAYGWVDVVYDVVGTNGDGGSSSLSGLS